MSHGIDVCRCGAVVMQCRCMGPHTKRVVCETCDACRSKPAPQPTTPAPTTASLHREMAEALWKQSDLGGLVKCGFALGTNECIDWKCHACGVLYSRPEALPLMNMRAPLPADMHCDRPRCPSVSARAALEGWEKRERLADDEAFMMHLASALFRFGSSDQVVADIRAVADALDALLYGERG